MTRLNDFKTQGLNTPKLNGLTSLLETRVSTETDEQNCPKRERKQTMMVGGDDDDCGRGDNDGGDCGHNGNKTIVSDDQSFFWRWL